MFEFVRTHTKILQFILFLLIFPSFVLFGVEGYSRMSDRGAVVAQVAGQDIHQSEWDAAHKTEADRMREQLPMLDAKLLDSPEARQSTLDRLIRDKVIAAAAQRDRMVVTDERLLAALQQDQALAAFRRPDGSTDVEGLKQALARQGMTPQMYDEQVRTNLIRRQVLTGISGSTLLAAAPAQVALGAYFEKREVQVARFDAAEFAAKITPTDADIEAYYQANPQQFQAPEQASIEYLVLDLESVKKGIAVNEADLKTYYEQNVASNAGKEERRASHILIAAPKDASAAERTAAKARAEELLAAVRQNPASFADLARKHSKDGSAAKGGDLEFLARGATVKPFEDALFALKKGETSGVVETDFGYHIIRLTDIKAPRQRTFEEMRPELEAQLKQQQAQRKYAESADAFSNAVYEQSDSLKGVAERFKLEVRTATGVQRNPSAGGAPALANPKFLAALFSADSLEKKRNTEAVEIAPGQMVAGRVTQHVPARTLPLEAVKAQVRERVKATRGAEMAKKAGADQLAAWKADPASAKLPAAVVVSREDPARQPRPAVEAALQADPTGLPALLGVEMGDAGYAVVRVVKSIPRTAPPEAVARQEGQQYAQWWSQAEALAYYNLLKNRHKVKVMAAAAPKDGASGK
jgi:peptidyl-prolyl cis-trans isomerase D